MKYLIPAEGASEARIGEMPNAIWLGRDCEQVPGLEFGPQFENRTGRPREEAGL
jgi:hypothetical protein